MAVQTWIYGKPDVQYEGCVIDTYEHNGYDDSDFYAVCWDKEKQALVTVEYDTTRCGGGGIAHIDATEETLHEVYRYYKRLGRSLFDTRTNIEQAKQFGKGDMVVVMRGRKVPKGTERLVFWTGTRYNQYSRRNEDRVGIEVDGERMFLPAEYVERKNWEEHLLTGKARKQKIRNFAVASMPWHFRSLFSSAEWRRASWLGQEPAWRQLKKEVATA